MKSSKILIIVIALTVTVSSQAATGQMKPGLWENSFIIKSQSGKIEKAMGDLKSQMANMPASQRKMMEEMMAKQGLGINEKTNTVKVCISKEQAQNLDFPQDHNQDCTHEVVKRTSNSIKVKFNCKGEKVTSGEGEFTLLSPTSYKGKSTINTMIDDKQDIMEMDQKGKWLTSNCGSIKPVQNKK